MPGLAGPLVPGTELAPGLPPPDEGPPREIVVKGPSIGLGQLVERDRWEPLTDDSGYLHTGDLGCVDHQGRLHLRGRSSSFLKVNGQRISPFEIEIALGSAPGVHEAVVVGAPDPMSGQRIVACLEPRAGQALDDTTAVADYCRAELAPYKVPHRFIVYDRLPRTAAGKPDRAQLRKEMEE